MISDRRLPEYLITLFTQLVQRLPIWIAALLLAAALARVIGLAVGSLPNCLLAALSGLSSFAAVFLGIVIEATPFLLLGCFASGIAETFIDRGDLAHWLPRRPLLAALACSLIGVFIPVGEVGVFPFARRLIAKGLPVPAAAAAMLAVPVLNPIVIASTLAAFGPGRIFWARIVLTLLIALLTGLLFSALPRPEALLRSSNADPSPQSEQPYTTAFKDRLRGALLISVDEFFGWSRYLVIGAGLAALARILIPQSGLLELGQGPVTSALAMLSMAALLSVGSTMDTFIALEFTNTFSAWAVLAFLVFGPMVDIKNAVLLLRIFKPRAAALLILVPLLTLAGTLFLINSGLRW